MNSILRISFEIWAAVVAVVLLLALRRLMIDKNEYTVLHIRRSEVSLIPKQVIRTAKLDRIDYWGKILTGAALLSGYILVLTYLYFTAAQPR
jgi:hypothetical protein